VALAISTSTLTIGGNSVNEWRNWPAPRKLIHVL
jgi:hypothetical protein